MICKAASTASRRCNQRLGVVTTSPSRSARVTITSGVQIAIQTSCALNPLRQLCGNKPADCRISAFIHGSVSGRGGQLPSLKPPMISLSALCIRASTGPRIDRRGWAGQLGRTVFPSISVFRICGNDLGSASKELPCATIALRRSAAARPSSPRHACSAPSASSILPSSSCRHDAIRSAARPSAPARLDSVGAVFFQMAHKSASGTAICWSTNT